MSVNYMENKAIFRGRNPVRKAEDIKTMTPIEKGYTCCNDCMKCTVHDTDCIVYSKNGRKRYEQWKKDNGLPRWL